MDKTQTQTNKIYSLEYILSFKDRYYDLPQIDAKFIVRPQKKRNNIKKKEIVHSIDNPWLSTQEQKKQYTNILEYTKSLDFLEQIKLKLINLLNKLSFTNFNIIVTDIIELKIENYEYLKELVNIIYNKCLTEETFIRLYVTVIKKIMKCWPSFKKEDGNDTNFITLFIEKCHINYKNWRKEIELKKKNTLNNLQLIGELFNNNIISYDIVSECILDLSNTEKEYKDFGIELLCNMLIIVGKKYEQVNYQDLNNCMNKLKNEKNISSKNKFLIMDIYDIRKNEWNAIKNKLEINKKGKKIVILQDDKLLDQIKVILIEYLDVLEMEEVKEYYLEYKSSNKEKIFCKVVMDFYIEQSLKNKEYLIELMKFMLDNNYLSVIQFKNNIVEIEKRKKEYAIDFPNIDKDIMNLEKIV